MFYFLLSAVLLLIQPAGGSSVHYSTLMPNVIVVEKEPQNPAQVPLLCGEAYEGMEITWRLEGTPLPSRGNRVIITVSETMGGNFSCHDNAGALLNHQLVLVQLIHKDPTHRKILERTTENSGYIKCLSRNYSGVFHCSWKWSPSRVGTVVHISAKRSSGRDNITCSIDENGAGITCLDQFQCSYAEEVDYINLRVFVRYMYRLEEYDSQFSITEIVKPDQINIKRVNGDTFELEYPKTWSGPASFFPLTFQIKVMRPKPGRDCDYEPHQPSDVEVIETQNQTFSVGSRRQYRLCVRAQDQLCMTGWSDWNHIEVKRA